MRAVVALLLLAVIVPSGGSAAPSALSRSGLFPAAGATKPSGPDVTVRVGTSVADTLRITPVTFLSKPGTNAGEGSKSMCGVIITARGASPQGVITVGVGVNEATPACDAVVAIGAVPPARGEATRRLGIIHAVSSQNAADGRAAVVLRRADGKWQVDDAATTRADTISRYTIAELRRIL